MKILPVFALVGIVFLLSGCVAPSPPIHPPATFQPSVPNPGTPTSSPTSPPVVAITIQNYAFSPQTVTVQVGTMVTWTNLDPFQHQISSSATGVYGPGQIFESKPLGKGDTYSYTFTMTGNFQYFCTLHQSMRGSITVQ